MRQSPAAGDDGFDNDKEVQLYRQQLDAREALIKDSIAIVCSKLNLHETNEEHPEGFSLLQEAAKLNYYPGYPTAFESKDARLPLKVFLSECYFWELVGRTGRSGYDKYFFGLLTLPTKYPYTVVRPETLADKINDFFAHAEVNFSEHKQFSSAYYMVTKDKDMLTGILRHKDLDAIAAMKEFLIEIVEDKCLFLVSTKVVNTDTAQQFCDGAKLLNKILNG